MINACHYYLPLSVNAIYIYIRPHCVCISIVLVFNHVNINYVKVHFHLQSYYLDRSTTINFHRNIFHRSYGNMVPSLLSFSGII
jgi:hypothetical protein